MINYVNLFSKVMILIELVFMHMEVILIILEKIYYKKYLELIKLMLTY